ncbi:anti-sigma factor [Aeromicrobium wangtongii]|uniref:anti-sigma factor n=1 Tax=Aeromicrobium wangtongii TaxID=2969247 RepID=UPI002017D6A4|nr:anti-sigma factor [Aeromicrobium wangtongii]MCL3819933.1 anti-sigma factor [Aeromicrobium wangtongii]
MNHPEVDELLQLARDGSSDEDVRRHVEDCEQCAAELQSMRRLVGAAAAIGPALEPDALVAPSSAVWDRIQAELAASDAQPPVVPDRSAAPRRGRRPMVVAVAAALTGIVLGGVGGYLLADDGSGDRTVADPRDPVAVGTLTPVGRDDVTGQIAISPGDRSRSLTITFSRAVTGPGYVEAWLLDPLTNEMLGLGVVGPEGGTVTVPADADLSRFTTVDISREPFDGDPAHSAESLARAVLRQV